MTVPLSPTPEKVEEQREVVRAELEAVNKLNKIGVVDKRGEIDYNGCCITGAHCDDWAPLYTVDNLDSNSFGVSQGVFLPPSHKGDEARKADAFSSTLSTWNLLPLSRILFNLMDPRYGQLIMLPTIRCLKRVIYITELWLRSKDDDLATTSISKAELGEKIPTALWRDPSVQPSSLDDPDDVFHAPVEDGDYSIDVFEYKLYSFVHLTLTRHTIDAEGKGVDKIYSTEARYGLDASGAIKLFVPMDFDLPPIHLGVHPSLVADSSLKILNDRLSRLGQDETFVSDELEDVCLLSKYMMDLLDCRSPSAFRSIPDRPNDLLGFDLPV